MRGEYVGDHHRPQGRAELPPHARRIPYYNHTGRPEYGTTSACAENTFTPPISCASAGNYLRMRGEYEVKSLMGQADEELPPRARRILPVVVPEPGYLGTTSACAENTPQRGTKIINRGNYLRVRGEYPKRDSSHNPNSELPPRARRILVRWARVAGKGGTTSACAENTFHKPCGEVAGGNYLRVRGEYLL